MEEVHTLCDGTEVNRSAALVPGQQDEKVAQRENFEAMRAAAWESGYLVWPLPAARPRRVVSSAVVGEQLSIFDFLDA
ncbi:hypothetical protein [Nesterenkonia populi]|uniref:hypothetical protein n=1 Tax=Nesterenkonia populi TaxID=1591087 RepID=UPI0011BFBFBB|nr:hypothetical protein [Nesterenkonia populi]